VAVLPLFGSWSEALVTTVAVNAEIVFPFASVVVVVVPCTKVAIFLTGVGLFCALEIEIQASRVGEIERVVPDVDVPI